MYNNVTCHQKSNLVNVGDDGKGRKTKSITEGFKMVLTAVRSGLYVSGDGEGIAH